MNYRKDRHGNDLSILGYGCMRFPRKMGIIDMKATEEQIMLAYKGGVNYFDTACGMEPQNAEYRQARDMLRSRAQNFGGGFNTQTYSTGCSPCGICTTFLCADCCCDCMSGGC